MFVATSGVPCSVQRPDERDLAEVEVETVSIVKPSDEGVELGGRNVVYPSALFAHQVTVRTAEVEERRPVRLMHVLDELPVAQRVERAIHGRKMNLRMRGVYARGEIVSSEVSRCAGQQLDDESTRGRDASSVGAQRVECSNRVGSNRVAIHSATPPADNPQLQGVRIWLELWIYELRMFLNAVIQLVQVHRNHHERVGLFRGGSAWSRRVEGSS